MDYLLKSSAIIALFYISYRLFLQRETFFESNRWFLFIGLIIAAALPSVVIPIYIEYTPAATNNTFMVSDIADLSTQDEPFNWLQLGLWIYSIGVCFFLGKFLIELTSLQRLIKKNPKKRMERFSLIEIFDQIAPFSFFKWIVYNPSQFKKNELQLIINHEKVHAKEHHTIDVLLAQLCCVLFWFNPLVWLYKKELQQNLEFIADKKAQTVADCKESYQRLLLKTSVPNHPLVVTNNFYNSLIKKRIIMLHKSKSNKLNAWKYALIIPVLALFLMSFNTREVYVAKNIASYSVLDKEFIITANSSDIELDEIKRYFKNKSVQIKFSDIIRNSDQTIKSLTLNTKHEDGTDYTKRMTVSKANSNLISSFRLAFNPGEDDIILNMLEEEANTVVGKHRVTIGKNNTIGEFIPNNSTNTTESKDNSIGENPIYVISGKQYKKEELPKKTVTTTGNIEQLSKKESEKRFGKAGKDGALIFNGKTSFNNFEQTNVSRLTDILITKDFSEADLNLAKAQLEKEGLKTKIRGVKRNSNGEIIAIKIEVSSEHSKASFNLNDAGPIKPIQITFDEDGKNISIGNGRLHRSHVYVEREGNIVMGRGANVVVGREANVVAGRAINIREDRHIERANRRSFIISRDAHEHQDHECTNDCDHDHNVIYDLHSDDNHEDGEEVIVKGNQAYIIKSSNTNNGKQTVTIRNSDGKEEVIEIKSDKNVYVLKSKNGTISTTDAIWVNDENKDEKVEFVFKNKSKGNSFQLSSDKGESPYILLDGKEITKKELGELDANNIKNVNVLKGESATNKYGSKAKDGAIIVTSKK